MSFAGHAFDMIQRQKENRELRKSITKGRADMSKPILGTYRDLHNVPAQELNEIHKSLREKKIRDDDKMAKNMFVLLVIGLIIGILVLTVMRLAELI